jgi:starvation-inducible outer membrane lipoprotein
MTMGKMRGHCVAVLFMGSMVVLMFLLAACSSTPKTTDGSDAREKDEKKENRWCIINIMDNNWDTLVEIWVAPFNGLSRPGLLK